MVKAIILAGGEGTRLRPLTCDRPKPMLPVMNKPILWRCIELLKKHGITEIALTLGYMSGKIKEALGDGSELGVKLSYFTEETPMGTAGSVRNAADFIREGDSFIVMSGSVITDIDLGLLIRFHEGRGALASVALSKTAVNTDYGMASLAEDGRITRFTESPDWGLAVSSYISTGIYALSAEVLDFIPEGVFSDFGRDIIPLLLKEPRGVYGLNIRGYWQDIGDLNAYRRCHRDILDGKVLLPLPVGSGDGVWLEKGAVIEQGAVIRPPVFVGSGSRIMRGARVEPYSVLGHNVTVRGGAGVKRSVVLDGCRIEENAQLRGAVVDEEATLRRGSAVYEQAVIGRSSVVGENCAVKPNVRIWPQKELPADRVQRTNLIWGSIDGGRIWTRTGLVGELGVEITPETMTRLGAALGTLAGCDRLAASDSGNPASAMLKSAFIGGVLSTGARLFDFGEQPLPVTRSGIRFHRLCAGAAINVYSQGGADYGEIRLMGPGGADPTADFMSELRGSFEREDFSRSGSDSIHEAEYLFEYKLFYLKNLINSTKKQSLGYKVIIGGSSPWAERLLISAGNDLNCHVEAVSGANALEIAERIKAEGADLGAVIGPSCQELTLVDGSGRIADRDMYRLLTAMVVMCSYKSAKIYVPVSAPSGVEELAARYGAEVIRTRNSPPELMRELTASNDPMLHDQFIYGFDAVGALIKLMDFMKSENVTLSELLRRLPETHIIHTGVDCENAAKSIEKLCELHKDQEPDLTDGIKLNFDRGWVLILPTENAGALNITSQGYCEEYARELADMCVDEILSNG